MFASSEVRPLSKIIDEVLGKDDWRCAGRIVSWFRIERTDGIEESEAKEGQEQEGEGEGEQEQEKERLWCAAADSPAAPHAALSMECRVRRAADVGRSLAGHVSFFRRTHAGSSRGERGPPLERGHVPPPPLLLLLKLAPVDADRGGGGGGGGGRHRSVAPINDGHHRDAVTVWLPFF